jgi:hypothetical protein
MQELEFLLRWRGKFYYILINRGRAYNLEPNKTNSKLGSLSKTNKNAYLSHKEILRFFPPKNELYL